MPSNQYQPASPVFNYNPGVQDRSGEIMAQGIASAGQSLGAAISAFAKAREDNNAFMAKAKSLEGFIRRHAEDVGADANDVLAVNPNESPRSRYERLSGTVENAFLSKKLQEANAAMAQNRFLREQQVRSAAALRNAFMSPAASAIQRGARFEQLGGLPAQVGAQDAARNFIAAGGTPDSATSQFFNAALDAETAQARIAAQAQATPAGYGTYSEAVAAAKAAGADSYQVQQTAEGRFIISTSAKRQEPDDGEPIGAQSVVETDPQTGKPTIFYVKGPDKKWRLINRTKSSGPALLIGYPGTQAQEE